MAPTPTTLCANNLLICLFIELPLVVAILLPRRLVQHLDLRIQHLLLLPRLTYLWLRELDAVFCLQLSGLCDLWASYWHYWFLDGLRFC